MADLKLEFATLRIQRRDLMLWQSVLVVVIGAALASLWNADLPTADTRSLAGIAFALLSWAAVRTVADTAALLATDCPACNERFFGGPDRAVFALPVPPRACSHCRIGLDGRRAPGRESDRSAE